MTNAEAGPSALCASCHAADIGVTDEERFAERLAPMAPQSLLAPLNCVGCHRPHTFRAAPPPPDQQERARAFGVQLAAAKQRLAQLLPAIKGCNPKAGPSHHVETVGDRLAIVDERGAALGDCNGDGEFAGEDPWLQSAVADAWYRRWYDLMVVERDKTGGLHNPEAAQRRIESALRGL